jgi:hypothetical protein
VERLVIVLLVRERGEVVEMVENGVWALCGGGGVDNVSILRARHKM